MAEKVLMKGNEAFAEAALRGGCRFYFGYPITPQSEIPEYMSHELAKRGGKFLQAESELGAINMAYGAAAAGGDVFISSSSPGIALMQEGMSFLCSARVPATILNVSRCGPGVGGIQPGGCDYYQMTRGGGNGDYRIPCFAPSNLQEAVDIIYEAPAIANKYRNPVFILADGMMGQMMEPIALPEYREGLDKKDIPTVKNWAVTGWDDRNGQRNVIQSLRMQPEDLEAFVENAFKDYAKAEEELARYEAIDLEGAEIVFVAFGTLARITKEAIEILASRGIKAGLIRPISLWPYPKKAFDLIDSTCKTVISTELSMGQMIDDVRIAVNGRFPVDLIHKTGGMVPTSIEIADQAQKILEGRK
ncbi:MAG: 3-methyl-2-oxobutanoate dehydrogenase subunit VorB [Erysipelotrichaceae bacterium]|nr:3-methyl-2-oxobutanoate dehydrogenase subunit VorB [Erysipelotrichaceae bacterium]